MQKLSKISFTVAVDQNAVIKLHKSGRSNVEIAKWLDMNRSTVWKIVKNFQETVTPLTDQGAEENGVYASLNSSKTRGKSCDETLAKAQNLDHRSRCEQIHHASGVEGQSGSEVIQDAASPGAYGQSCGHEGPKMQGNPPRVRPRVHRREEVRHPVGSKPAK